MTFCKVCQDAQFEYIAQDFSWGKVVDYGVHLALEHRVDYDPIEGTIQIGDKISQEGVKRDG